MGSISIIHWLIMLALFAVWIVPLYLILGRIGWSRALAFLDLIPPLALVLLWVIALGTWKPERAHDQS